MLIIWAHADQRKRFNHDDDDVRVRGGGGGTRTGTLACLPPTRTRARTRTYHIDSVCGVGKEEEEHILHCFFVLFVFSSVFVIVGDACIM